MGKRADESAQLLAHTIVAGIQEKKGRAITLLDMRELDDAICDFMVIAEGNTPIQLEALEGSVADYTRLQLHEKPTHTHRGDGHWIAMDYISVIVHLFTPELREYYNIEQLWADAQTEQVPDLD